MIHMPFINLNLFEFKKWPILGAFIDWAQTNDFDYGLVLTITIGFLLFVSFSGNLSLFSSSFSFFFALIPIWLPLVTLDLMHFRWMDYVGKIYYLKSGRSLFRIKLPPEVLKSPEAMEYVLAQTHQPQHAHNLMETYLDGRRALPVSLELVSIGGDVRFYIGMDTKKAKESFIPAMYSQYPGVEIIEEPVDYAGEIPTGSPDWEMYSSHVGKKEKAYGPIRTYVDRKLDSMPKEEEKVDPMTAFLEFLGGMGPNERLYFQFTLIAERHVDFKNGQLIIGSAPGWKKGAQARVEEIMKRDPETKASIVEEEEDYQGSVRITSGEREDVEAIERNMTKPAFNVGITYIYFAKKGHFRGNLITSLNALLKLYDRAGRGTVGTRWRSDYNYRKISDPFGKNTKRNKRQAHREYKLRKYNPKNFKDSYKIFTVEELATMYHLPGTVAATPSMSRVASTRSEAPSNLPVGDLPENS
jgi:hypothetical protein